MRISVAIPTRNRPDFLGRALASVLACTRPADEVIVVDQSEDAATKDITLGFRSSHTHIRYIHSAVAGVSLARNLAIRQSMGDVLAFTDDDCIVPADWLTTIAELFDRHLDVELVYGQVRVPDELRGCDGVVPALRIDRPRRISHRHGFQMIGMTANAAARRSLFGRVFGFDEMLGPGTDLPSGEDFDFLYRAFRAGCVTLITPRLRVDHYGLRSSEDWPRRATEYGAGDAAFYLKHIRCGDTFAGWLFARHLARMTPRQVAKMIRRRPHAGAYLHGIASGVRTSRHVDIDCQLRLYRTFGAAGVTSRRRGAL